MKLSKTSSAFVMIALSAGSILSLSQLVKAQTCSGSSYWVDKNGKCVDLSGLQVNQSPDLSSKNTNKIYIVKFKDNTVGKDQVFSLTSQIARQSRGQLLDVFQEAIQGMTIQISPAAVKVLQQLSIVESIEENQPVKLDLPIPQTSAAATSVAKQVIPWGVIRIGGFGNGTGKTVWVFDTGIDSTHPDLRVDRIRAFTAFKVGTVEGKLGYNDGNGHGTHVAGTIAALNNNIGVVGVAAGATVVPVKVLDSNGNGSLAGIIAGIDHVVSKAKAGDVVNMSLGAPFSPVLDNAVRAAAAKGIKFVVAAGNESLPAYLFSPARVNSPNIYTISAFGKGDVFAWFSNHGNPPIDYAAPGVQIMSTWLGGKYHTISGTSMAAPHAAGILLLGSPKTSGSVIRDRDSFPDRIISR